MPKAAIYLDYAAATPLDPEVLAIMQPYLSAQFYNPSALYQAAIDTRKALEVARTQVAHWLGARPSEIIFTAGGTEANNLAVHGIMRRFPEANLVVSAVEHEAILAPAQRYDCRLAMVDAEGRLRLDSLEAAIDESTVLVSIMYANNEVGTVQPIREIGHLLGEIRTARSKAGNKLPLYFHTDACQAGNYLDLHAARLGVDLMTVNGGKLYGPKQSGALFVSGGLTLEPLVDGGGQERGLRSGTENVAGSLGFATALDRSQQLRHEETGRLSELQHYFIAELQRRFPSCVINGSRKFRLANNIHVTFPGYDNERLLVQLDIAGVQAAAGSACSASNEEPSHVLRAMGISEADAQSSIRFTLGRSTTKEQLTTTLEALQKSLS